MRDITVNANSSSDITRNIINGSIMTNSSPWSSTAATPLVGVENWQLEELGLDGEVDLNMLGHPGQLGTLDPRMVWFREVLNNLDHYFVPLIIMAGTVGNTMSFVVFVATHLKRSSCNIYLASLAIADNAFLLCVFVSWSDKFGVTVYNRQGWCQLLVYLTYVSSFLSVWYVVSFTMERYLVVCYPLHRSTVCAPRTATRVVLGLALFALLAYSFALFTAGVIQFEGVHLCAPLPDYFRVVSTINNIDTLVTLVIPTFIITGCNIHITCVVCHFYRTDNTSDERYTSKKPTVQKWNFSQPKRVGENSILSGDDSCVPGSGRSSVGNPTTPIEARGRLNTTTTRLAVSTRGAVHLNITQPATPPPPARRQRRNAWTFRARTSHIRATRMLLIVSTVFLVCNLPSHAVRTYGFVMQVVDRGYQPTPAFVLLQKFFNILYYLNFAVNFFLYSLSGRSFRNGMRRLIVKLRKKASNCRDKKNTRCCGCDKIPLNQRESPVGSPREVQTPPMAAARAYS